MSKQAPDHHDAEIVLKVYDLRRETVMRESRDAINRDFWPKNEAEALAVLQPDHPLNRAWRQVSTYWEMVYGLAYHGAVNAELLLDSNGEGMFLFSKMQPYLAQLRAATSPRTLSKAEWVATQTDVGRTMNQIFQKRIAAKLSAK